MSSKDEDRAAAELFEVAVRTMMQNPQGAKDAAVLHRQVDGECVFCSRPGCTTGGIAAEAVARLERQGRLA